MFGEVADTTQAVHVALHDARPHAGHARLPVPGRGAQTSPRESAPTDALRDFFADDDWYTDADSNAYQLPTFLGNHDMGRIGRFIQSRQPRRRDAELLARDRLAHELMYFSRGNPVIYYGDEQGFTGDGGDQVARQDMFPSQVAEYNDDDLIGTTRRTPQDELRPGAPALPVDRPLAKLTREHPALRDGAQQHRYSSDGAGHLRVLAHRPRRAARVRRRAQQRRAAEDGGRSRPTSPSGGFDARLRRRRRRGSGPAATAACA